MLGIHRPSLLFDHSLPTDEWYDGSLITDFEEAQAAWSRDDHLLAAQDWPGLLQHRTRQLRRYPDDPFTRRRLGEAYVLAGQPACAVEVLGELHREYPEFTDAQDVLLDALFALGRSEDDFPWVERPTVLRLTPELLDRCYALLADGGDELTHLPDLYGRLLFEGYLAFGESELLAALAEDSRFTVGETASHATDCRLEPSSPPPPPADRGRARGGGLQSRC